MPDRSNYIAIDAGFAYSLALRSTGEVDAWGHAYFGNAQGQGGTVPSPIVERYSYDVYGKPTIKAPDNTTIRTTSNFGNRFMFTGREYDTETGNYYYRARYYSPKIGRFLQTDPIRYNGGLNLYSYCENNPINWYDPLGFMQVTIAGGYFVGGRITIAKNNGQWSGSAAAGLGMGFYISYDNTNTGIREPGLTSTRVSELSLESGRVGGTITYEASGPPSVPTLNQYDLTTSIGTPNMQYGATKNLNTGKVSKGVSASAGSKGGMGAVSVIGFIYAGQDPSEKECPKMGDFNPLIPPGGGGYT